MQGKSISIIDASNEFAWVGSRNYLLLPHQQKIRDTSMDQGDDQHCARLAPSGEIARIVARHSVLRVQIDAILSDLEGVEA